MAKLPAIEFSLSPIACIGTALALLILPLEWIAAAAAAAVFHELCHIIALCLCGVHIYGLSVGAEGARIKTEPMGRWQELCCALAGPLGSFFLVLLIRWVPMIGICAGVQGLYNLVPVYPLDGGRVMRSLLGKKAAGRIGKWSVIFFVFVGICFTIRWKLGIGAVFVLLLLIRKIPIRKIPCKDGSQAVQ